jgi:hypothetical protein
VFSSLGEIPTMDIEKGRPLVDLSRGCDDHSIGAAQDQPLGKFLAGA